MRVIVPRSESERREEKRKGKETPVDGAPVLYARTATNARMATNDRTNKHAVRYRSSSA
jgi:hypothetical protein